MKSKQAFSSIVSLNAIKGTVQEYSGTVPLYA